MAFIKPRNMLQIIGNVGRKPTLRETNTSGRKVCNVSLAVNDSYKDSDGNKVERTTWFRGTAWGATAEVIARHVDKGDRLLLAGKPHINESEEYGASMGLTIASFEFLGSAGNGGASQQAEPEPVNEDDIPF